jgi:carboxynorspermidine decarboxylase
MSLPWDRLPSPSFILDKPLLRQNMQLIEKLRAETGIRVLLALKGFSMYHVFDEMRPFLDGTTASSLHEARLGQEEFGGETHIFAPAFQPHEFEEIAGRLTHISFNSLAQYERFSPDLFRINPGALAGIRINPEYSPVGVSLYNPCAPGSRLGVRSVEMPVRLPESIRFLHCHNLCESDAEGLAGTLQAIEERFGPWLEQVDELNLGGGHLVTRAGYDLALFRSSIAGFRSRHPHLSLLIEPGSALIWETGYLLTRVLDIINTSETPVALLDASISTHMPDVIEMPYRPAVLGEVHSRDGGYTYRFGGLTCLAGDFVGDYSFVQPLKPGDPVVFMDMMHYTMVKTTTFNGVNLPEIGIWDGHDYTTVKKFGYEDFRSRL